MYKSFGKLEGSILGSTERRVEQGGMRAVPPHMRAGRLSGTGIGQSELEGFGRGEGDSDSVTEHQVGAGEEGLRRSSMI